ncbi:hypothetical protein ACFL5V_13810, partial [Fibrobacterota bacterium]
NRQAHMEANKQLLRSKWGDALRMNDYACLKEDGMVMVLNEETEEQGYISQEEFNEILKAHDHEIRQLAERGDEMQALSIMSRFVTRYPYYVDGLKRVRDLFMKYQVSDKLVIIENRLEKIKRAEADYGRKNTPIPL